MSVDPGLTVAEVAKRYRVSPDKVRGWLRRGELAAINTSSKPGGKPRFVVTREALERFEQGRSAADPPKPQRRRRPRRPPGWIDFASQMPDN